MLNFQQINYRVQLWVWKRALLALDHSHWLQRFLPTGYAGLRAVGRLLPNGGDLWAFTAALLAGLVFGLLSQV